MKSVHNHLYRLNVSVRNISTTTVNSQSTLADLDCGFSRPAAADRPGSGFGLWISGSAGSSGFGLLIFAAGGGGSARVSPGRRILDCRFSRPAAVARRGSDFFSIGFQLYAITFIRISVVRHKFHCRQSRLSRVATTTTDSRQQTDTSGFGL